MTDGPFEENTSADGLDIIDAAFAQAFNEVHHDAPRPENAQGAVPTPGAGGGDETQPPPAEGAGTEQPGGETPPAGTQPNADPADVITGTVTEPEAGTTEPAGDGSDQQPPAAPAGAPSGPVRSHAEVVTQLSVAHEAIEKRLGDTFQRDATAELNEKWGPQIGDILGTTPYLLVGQPVPDLRGGKEPVRLRDTEEASQYQASLKHVFDSEVKKIVTAKENDVKPIMSVVQDSIQLFENNKDLYPGTAEFDKDLADRFAKVAKSFEVIVNGKLYGWQGNMQPLINELRSELATRRGAAGVTQQQPQQPSARQQQAATQPRQDNGQFDGPQASIASKAGMSGTPDDDDWGTFWDATGFGQSRGMVI